MFWKTWFRHEHKPTPQLPRLVLPELVDVTNYSTEIDLTAFEIIRWAPAWLTRAERLFLFSFTFGLRPARYLEIGTFQGGSALIVAAAMDAAGAEGKMVCIDPEPKIAPDHWQRIQHRATLVAGSSPDVLTRAQEIAGGAFELVFIDGDHSARGVMRDAKGVLPFVVDGGYIIFHDAFYSQVGQALDEFVQDHANKIVDCGWVTRETTTQVGELEERIYWGGLRLMRKRISTESPLKQ